MTNEAVRAHENEEKLLALSGLELASVDAVSAMFLA